jgi:uncharacterized membrane-anchored protein
MSDTLPTRTEHQPVLSKVPAVTLMFWIVKILATTLGETAGDTVSMTLHTGYLVGTAIFLPLLAGLIAWQIRAPRFNAWLYWATIIASTTAGTTLADFATRSLGIGYPGGSLLLFALVAACLIGWRLTLGAISVDTVSKPREELFYWATITASQTLGTALGDWTADTGGLGYLGAAGLFAALLILVAVLYFRTGLNRAVLFWSAFILTRPLGAAVGDFLDKPVDHGGLALSRPLASLLLIVAIAILLWRFPQRSGIHAEKT